MKTIYSILYVTLNTALNERVGIGLVMSNGTHTMFKHSSEKLLAIKGIIDVERYNFVRSYMRSLENDMNIAVGSNGLFENKLSNRNWVTESYINYLSRYSNNLIQFSEPKFIDIDFDPNNFKSLFEKYVYTYGQEAGTVQIEPIFEKVKRQLYPIIHNRVNLDISLDATHFENLFAPIEVNFIGINETPVTGQTIDFGKKHYFLENDIVRFVSLTKAIELKDKIKGQYFVLGREPENNNDKSHLLWSQIRDSDFLEFVDIDEIGIVSEYLETHGVRPYFGE